MVQRALVVILALALHWTVAVEAAEALAEGRELLRDPSFSHGFSIYDPPQGKQVVVGRLQRADDREEPAWGLAQWSSRRSIAGVAPVVLPSGALRCANEAKTIILGGPEADLTLGVNAFWEYEGKAREKGQAWPHLLASQTFQDSPSIADLVALRYRVGVRLARSQAHDVPGLSPQLHAAQFLSFITLQNRNRESKGYGDFVWFGIPLYDSRWRIPHSFIAPDVAHHKLIYTPPGDTYTEESVHDGEWVRIDRDILPLMHEAFKTAWERGCLLDSRDFADYRLGSISIGWEVPGPLDVEMQVKGLGLTSEQRGGGRSSPLPPGEIP